MQIFLLTYLHVSDYWPVVILSTSLAGKVMRLVVSVRPFVCFCVSFWTNWPLTWIHFTRIVVTIHSSPGVKVIRSTPQINVRFSKGGNNIELTSILGVFSSKFLFLAASHIATSALWHFWHFLLFLFLAVQARLLFGKRQISLLVSLAAQTAYATPGCGAHLHFTGLEPAVGLRPALWTLDHTSSTICRCLGRNFFKVLFPQSTVCIRYSLQLKAIHMGSVPGTTTFSSQSAIILDATLLLYVVFWFK